MKTTLSRTKIIATMGPASSPKEVLKEMIINGLDVCRLNFSHGKHEEHLKVMNTIREINAEINSNVAILADLQGPKLRVGDMENLWITSRVTLLVLMITITDITKL